MTNNLIGTTVARELHSRASVFSDFVIRASDFCTDTPDQYRSFLYILSGEYTVTRSLNGGLKQTEKESLNMNFKDSDYADFIQGLKNVDSPHLVLLIGLYEPDKKKAVKEITRSAGAELRQFDFNDIVSKIESETFENIDRIFEDLGDNAPVLHFSNGDKLCGAYTGFTHSKVKYATPQERYFLRKIRDYDGLIIVDITETDSADETIRRAANTIVNFPLPKSPIRRILWHLKHYSLHGYDIKTKRPESYADTSANF